MKLPTREEREASKAYHAEIRRQFYIEKFGEEPPPEEPSPWEHDEEGRYHTTKQVAKRTGYHRSTIHRWCCDGRIKAHRPDKWTAWRIPQSEVDRLLAMSAAEPDDAA